uniref:Uncharacterized protein n=1 Tax=viral metagenome TaxID=1070528 RepID=A0A6H1ZBW6_9ZZZZ
MNIKYYTRYIYGTPKNYVLDVKEAKILTDITGTTTLTDRHIKALKKIGLTFERVLD